MRKGFTLVELIAVVAILGILATIAGISYTTINNKHKKISCENLKKQIENAAIEFVQDNNLLHENNELESNYNELVDYGYLESGLKNPMTNETVESDIVVKKDSNGNYTASASLICGD